MSKFSKLVFFFLLISPLLFCSFLAIFIGTNKKEKKEVYEWDKLAYEKILREYIESGNNTGIVERFNQDTMTREVLMEVEPGPPLRAVFPQWGIMDNWWGIIYDPSGFVEEANKFKSDWSNWDDPELQKVKKLFGGDMVKCDKLEEGWYLCSFT